MILEHKGTTIFYTEQGSGATIVLLHGFLEDHSMWLDTIAVLSKKNRVITIDLLGHGKTGCIGYIHTMEHMADAVNHVLTHLNLQDIILVGHSMGGYVALDYAKRFTENVKGLCLLNSTYEADNEERKLLRTRANKMVQNNFENMVRMSFSNLFSTQSKQKHNVAYQTALKTALKTPLQGYMAAQEGMKQRKDNSDFFIQSTFKKIILLGEKDAVLDAKTIIQFSEKHNIKSHVFSEGHMSFIENKEEYLQKLLHFVE